jgi:hypothetical protein
MIPNDVDPSLCAAEPLLESLEDGFSPPARESDTSPPTPADAAEPAESALGPKSPF